MRTGKANLHIWESLHLTGDARWDPQERRNYGETVHEDNDILGIFSPEEYTHFKPGWGAVLLGTFVASVGVLCGVVYRYYPDQVWPPTQTFSHGGYSLTCTACGLADV